MSTPRGERAAQIPAHWRANLCQAVGLWCVALGSFGVWVWPEVQTKALLVLPLAALAAGSIAFAAVAVRRPHWWVEPPLPQDPPAAGRQP